MTTDPLQSGARRVLEGALRVVGRDGLDAVTHRAVAAESGVSPGAVAHHFPSRDALVDAALRFAVGRELERLRAFALDLQTKVFDRVRWVDAIVGWYARELETEAETHIACYEAFLAAARDDRYREIVREWFDTYERSAELAVRAAGSHDPTNHARLFVSTLIGLVLQQLAAPRHGFRQTATAQLTALVDGLVGRNDPSHHGPSVGKDSRGSSASTAADPEQKPYMRTEQHRSPKPRARRKP